MAQPATGVSFKVAGLAYINSLRARRGGRWQVIARDYGGASTDISPGGDFGAPMALDGQWRDDFFAVKQTANKQWVYNNQPNLGFYPIGFIHVDGIERSPKIDSDPLQGLQSLDPLRVDVQKRDKTLMFTPMERNIFVDALRFNQPLSGVLERAAVEGTYFAGETSDDEPLRRQVFVMHEDKQGGLSELNAFPFPKCVLTDLGAEKGNRKDADAAKFTLSREIDPFFVDADGVPLLDGRWTSGSLWDQDSIPALTFVPPAPVFTALTATTAKFEFAQPIGGTSPYTYTAETSPDGVGSWTGATEGAVSVLNGVVTLNISALTTGTDYFGRVTVTDAAAVTALSAVSNEITTP